VSPRARAYAELTRPPALCTAPSDAITGLALTLTALGDTSALHNTLHSALAPACAVSVCLYAAGMITNDLFDARLDAQERPERPIPSGRVSARGALTLALTLQGLALTLSATHSHTALTATALTCGATYLYNALLKSTPLGPLSMAACRVGNLWIGITWGLPALPGGALSAQALTGALALTGATALYITSLTALARHEVHGDPLARPFGSLLTLCALSPLLTLPLTPITPERYTLALTLALTLTLTLTLTPHLRSLLSASTSAARAMATRQLVGAGIKGVALLNAAFCATLSAWPHAALLILLSLCAKRVARWFYAT
jgi:4-hydroxybenzoate polyprenyltransferase